MEAYQAGGPHRPDAEILPPYRGGRRCCGSEAAAWQTYSGAVNAVLRACPGLDPA